MSRAVTSEPLASSSSSASVKAYLLILMSLLMLRRTKHSSKVSSKKKKNRAWKIYIEQGLLGKVFSLLVPEKFLDVSWVFEITRKGCD